ncbi:MAG: hypothetical protein GAK31_03223 [Stenotrophomonas maltophilia]|uniref:DUF2971 domain-containing protein n=1 Tax=Stenotrophomonas maltophilia TaxID=40324 RepID=A0A7V8FF46_STEMA|nr:MAG: hypothetical protein GAK31_03223 [Stenotrophomonas maltophilia]
MTTQYIKTHLLRYLSLEKFQLLLSDRGLFFSRASVQSDEDEGRFDPATLSNALREHVDEAHSELLAKVTSLEGDRIELNRDTSFLSCWYSGSDECKGMWDAFAEDGTVIQSDNWALQDALREHARYITYARVTYDDQLKKVAVHDPLHVINEIFAGEREYRAILDSVDMKLLTGTGDGPDLRVNGELAHQSPLASTGGRVPSTEEMEAAIVRKSNGYVVRCDLNMLVQQIRVHPGATDAFRASVEAQCRAAGLGCPVAPSELDTPG